MSKDSLFLIDATAFCYRAFYGLKGLATSFGQSTNAVYGFTSMLNKILKEKKPKYVAACFDVSRDTFRSKKFVEYKTNRPPMPEGLSSQLPLIKQLIAAYGIASYELEGYEADDIIATLSKKAKEKKMPVTIVSSDKDMLQLADENTVIFSPYKDEGVTYDYQEVVNRFGVEPKSIVDIVALMGDGVDNIPGVPGIGEKTAVELIKTFGSLEKLLGHCEAIKKPKLRESICAHIDMIKLNRELALLDSHMDLEFELDKLKIGDPDYKELFRLFKYLEFNKLLKELPVEEGQSPDVKPAEKLSLKDFSGLASKEKELVVYGENIDELAFGIKGKIFQLQEPKEKLEEVLAGTKVAKIGHDLKKLKVSLSKNGHDLGCLCFDTMVAAYLLNPSKPSYGLNDLAWDYLGKTPSKMDNQSAVWLIEQLRPKLEEQLQEKSLYNLFMSVEMPLVSVLAQMELSGIKLDLELLSGLSVDVEKKLIKLIVDIYALCGCEFNLNSPKQLREVLFEKLKLPVVKRTKTGPSTDESVLRALADKHKLPALLLEYRQLMKLKTTYIDVLPQLVDKKTGRLHTTFNQTATETGRLSSSEPNLQNIPIKTEIGSRIRQAIISSGKDSYLLSCDYSQIELRILAHLSKDENLISAFKQDKDIHKATAALIYDIEEKEVTDAMRETAKRVNFGIIYGLSSFGLSRDLGIPVAQAQEFIDAYFLRYPHVHEYILRQIKEAREKGFVTTILGRRRFIPEINNKNQNIRQFAERQAVNTPVQGSASDLIKLAMIRISGQLQESGLKAKMILQIHDELVFDVNKEELSSLAALVKDGMENVLKLVVPVKVEMKKGLNWLKMEEVK